MAQSERATHSLSLHLPLVLPPVSLPFPLQIAANSDRAPAKRPQQLTTSLDTLSLSHLTSFCLLHALSSSSSSSSSSSLFLSLSLCLSLFLVSLSRWNLWPLCDRRWQRLKRRHTPEKRLQRSLNGWGSAPWKPTRGDGGSCNAHGQGVASQRCTAVFNHSHCRFWVPINSAWAPHHNGTLHSRQKYSNHWHAFLFINDKLC